MKNASDHKIEPYKGDDCFLFVSYRHTDYEKIENILEYLSEKGCRFWYDVGIDPGTEWADFIAGKLEQSDGVICFITDDYLRSENCRDELEFARDCGKPRLMIYMEDVVLPKGLAMRANRNQAIFAYKYSDKKNDLFDRLDESPMIASHYRTEEGAGSDEVSDSSLSDKEEFVHYADRKKAKTSKFFPWFCIIVGIICFTNAEILRIVEEEAMGFKYWFFAVLGAMNAIPGIYMLIAKFFRRFGVRGRAVKPILWAFFIFLFIAFAIPGYIYFFKYGFNK